MNRRHFLQYATFAGSSLAFTSCIAKSRSSLQIAPSPTASPMVANKPLKVGLVYLGTLGDSGWNYTHDLGRQQMEVNLQTHIKTTFIENLKSGAEAERAIRQLAEDGNRLIFVTDPSFTNSTLKVAQDFPQVAFEQCRGHKVAANVGIYKGRDEEPRYLTGMIAGKMTKSNLVGFVATYPTPEVIRSICAFTQGLRSTNTLAKVKVSWVHSGDTPNWERDAVQGLVKFGADVLSQDTNSAAVIQLAEEKGIYVFGYNSDTDGASQTTYLTSVVDKWGQFYTDQALAVMNGTWKGENVWGGIGKGMVDISPINQLVPPEVQQLVNAKRQDFIQGTAHPFDGPIRDQKGVMRVHKGRVLDDQGQLAMNWYVQGVEGTVPKGVSHRLKAHHHLKSAVIQ